MKLFKNEIIWFLFMLMWTSTLIDGVGWHLPDAGKRLTNFLLAKSTKGHRGFFHAKRPQRQQFLLP